MLSLKSENDVLCETACAVRAQRLLLGWRQTDLATRSGVAIATLRRFERTGQIGFQSIAKLLVSLGLADAWLSALKPRAPAPHDIASFLSAGAPAPRRQRVRIPSARP